MAKPVSTIKKIRKQHSPEFRQKALKLAERIAVAAAAREFSCPADLAQAREMVKESVAIYNQSSRIWP